VRGPATASRYWLTRFLILRLLGFVYLCAFLSLAIQVVPLVGEHGLLPAGSYLDRAAAHLGGRLQGFLLLPSVFWLDLSDGLLTWLSWLGVGLSAAVLCGYANALLMTALWVLYFSFVSIGQDWYSYGWEIQLLETGALGIFLCPLLDGRPFPRRAPPAPILWLFRWLAFRIMLGAGLIKMRGDACWRELTCLSTHYETQPIPNPLSRTLHFMPLWFHKGGALFNHLVELVCPFFVFYPRILRRIAGALMVAFQVILILSGNLSFLNYLTIVPALACFDDDLLKRVLPRRLAAAAERAAQEAARSRGQQIAVWSYVCVVIVLSLNPIANLVSRQQRMNSSFERLHLVNTYGAFGSVGEERHEIVFEGTSDEIVGPATQWKEYEFWCKPGDPMRRPCLIAPLQPRLDWQIWFAAMSRPERYPWTLHLVYKLLRNDPGSLSLLSTNPFPDAPPRYVRAAFFKYEFAPPVDASGAWWRRTYLGEWLPPLSAEDPRLLRVMQIYGWPTE
jgi:Lipase maturation factor